MIIIMDAPCHSRCGALNCSMAIGAEYRSKFAALHRVQVKICSPSPAMVMSPNEWKILEWDEKLQTNIYMCHIVWTVLYISNNIICSQFIAQEHYLLISIYANEWPYMLNVHTHDTFCYKCKNISNFAITTTTRTLVQRLVSNGFVVFQWRQQPSEVMN